MVTLSELSDHGCRLVDGSGYEVRIFTMCGIPVASVEDSDRVFAEIWERLEEADEAMFVVDLYSLRSANTAREI